MSRPSPGEAFLSALAEQEKTSRGFSFRVLLLAAHPDDETISASVVLGRLSGTTVVYLTDGAPRHPQFRSPVIPGSRQTYAVVRATEAVAALSLAGVPPQQIVSLNGVDQEAVYAAEDLLDAFVAVAERVQPDVILTHSYEGGHPDHDAAALIAFLTIDELERRGLPRPALLEFTSYHAVNGSRVAGEFLAAQGIKDSVLRETALSLPTDERVRKEQMIACYASQSQVLASFPLEPERLRMAPSYDFTQAPHPGPLWYECLHWPMTSRRWCELASALVSRRGLTACR